MVASIEAPFALLEEPVKVFRLDTVKAAQVPFGLIPEIFYSIDMIIVFCKLLGMIDAMMMESVRIILSGSTRSLMIGRSVSVPASE